MFLFVKLQWLQQTLQAIFFSEKDLYFWMFYTKFIFLPFFVLFTT